MVNQNIDIIAVAPLINKKINEITGPAVMYKYFIESEEVKKRATITTFDISGDKKNRKIGGVSINRIFFYLNIIPKIFLEILKKKYSRIYIIIAPSKVGLLRDSLIIIFSKIMKRKIFCHAFGNYPIFYENSNFLIRSIIKNIIFLSNNIIVEDDIFKEKFKFIKNYQNKVKIIPNCYPYNNKRSYKKKTFDGKKIKILFMGNMIISKGYFDVLKAVNLINRKTSLDVFCHFAGRFYNIKSNYENNIEESKNKFFDYIKENNLSDKVRYHDFIYDEEKKNIFNDINFFIFPTNYIYEVQPLSIIEAMSYGSIIITCKHGAITSMIEDGKNGYFVKYNKPKEIFDKIIHLSKNTDEFNSLSRNVIQTFEEKFMLNNYSNKILDLM